MIDLVGHLVYLFGRGGYFLRDDRAPHVVPSSYLSNSGHLIRSLNVLHFTDSSLHRTNRIHLGYVRIHLDYIIQHLAFDGHALRGFDGSRDTTHSLYSTGSRSEQEGSIKDRGGIVHHLPPQLIKFITEGRVQVSQHQEIVLIPDYVASTLNSLKKQRQELLPLLQGHGLKHLSDVLTTLTHQEECLSSAQSSLIWVF